MKRLVFVLALLMARAAAGQPVPHGWCIGSYACVGNQVIVGVEVGSDQNIAIVGVALGYDPERLSYVGVTCVSEDFYIGGMNPDWDWCSPPHPDTWIYVAVDPYDIWNGIEGTFKLLEFTFNKVSCGATVAYFAPNCEDIYNQRWCPNNASTDYLYAMARSCGSYNNLTWNNFVIDCWPCGGGGGGELDKPQVAAPWSHIKKLYR